MSKYYTPELEEFHVGFEYEYLYKNSAWVKHTINTKADLVLCIEEVEEDLIRTKYLDREDIESLGWSYSLTFSKEGVYDEYSKTDGEHGDYYLRVHNTGGLSIGEHWVQLDVFKGTIKNKSELKRILKQLGI